MYLYWEEDDKSTSPNTIYLKFNTIGDVVKLISKKGDEFIVLKLFNEIVE
jgi:hypothetical protein